MKFVDEADVEVKAGDGGAGSVHFRREKYVPFGGPDGGNGGNGGSVVLVADSNRHTLLDLKLKSRLTAENGGAGGGSLRNGKNGSDLVLRIPVGTQIFAADRPAEPIADLTADGQRYVIARGGRGGKGNAHFKTATNQAPRKAQPGEPGEEGRFVLSLKLLADVGLVGLPNAGKSTFISRVSSAKPKIADYPFTTLEPNRGVVRIADFSHAVEPGETPVDFVVADIPGLIEGAHEGKGLGVRFLKHLERTTLLLHLVDVSLIGYEGVLDPLEAFEQVERELHRFSAELAQKPRLVGLTKVDAIGDRAEVDELARILRNRGFETFVISSASGEGINRLVTRMGALVAADKKQRAQTEDPGDESVFDTI